jgi:hypothetical protein
MSEPVRMALVMEGATDFVVLSAALTAIFDGRDFEVQVLQPEFSEAFENVGGDLGLGWAGVYRWCRQAAAEGEGRVRNSILFSSFDSLILHLDADVAGKTYASGRIDEAVPDLPCEQPCPPALATTDALRTVVLRWLGEADLPPRFVFCTPSKSTETWVMAALFPKNKTMARQGWECYPNPDAQLGQQPKKNRIKKTVKHYQSKTQEFEAAWPRLSEGLTEAGRFSKELQELLNAGDRQRDSNSE